MTLKKLDYVFLSVGDMIEYSRSFLENIIQRRTVRDFSDKPVPIEIIENAIKSASSAPSGANKQPWHFVIVKDPVLKKEIRIAAEKEEKEFYEHRASDDWLEELNQFWTDWHKPFLEIAPYLIEVFKNFGGTLIEEEVKDILSYENKIKIETKENKFICDNVVITAGVFSEKLSKKYGANVPMQSERGYHLELSGTNVKLKYPLMNGYLKLAITPRPSGIRFAGLVEFGSIDSNPNTKAYDLLIRNAKSMFPKITFKEKQEWSGHRPATVDSLPLIGPSQINEKVFFAYGHHHVGLTAGPKTGKLISKSILRDNDQIDLTAYKPNR